MAMAQSDQRCPDNAVFSECTSHCPAACDSDPTVACIESCAPAGCVCKQGYVLRSSRNNDKRQAGFVSTVDCIPRSECPGNPGNECTDGQIIKSTNPCEHCSCRDGKKVCVVQGCPAPQRCADGSEAKPAPGQCCPTGCPTDPEPQKCPVNEEWDQCGGCEGTCKTGLNIVCTKDCRPGRCRCKAGFVRLHSDISVGVGGKNKRLIAPTNPCVPVKECDGSVEPTCGDNEVYRECSGCERTCEDVGNNDAIVCPAVCGPAKCQCKPGFVRKHGNTKRIPVFFNPCVAEKECDNSNPEPECPEGEQWSECAGCEETCDGTQGLFCTATLACQKRCVCKPGYVREVFGGAGVGGSVGLPLLPPVSREGDDEADKNKKRLIARPRCIKKTECSKCRDGDATVSPTGCNKCVCRNGKYYVDARTANADVAVGATFIGLATSTLCEDDKTECEDDKPCDTCACPRIGCESGNAVCKCAKEAGRCIGRVHCERDDNEDKCNPTKPGGCEGCCPSAVTNTKRACVQHCVGASLFGTGEARCVATWDCAQAKDDATLVFTWKFAGKKDLSEEEEKKIVEEFKADLKQVCEKCTATVKTEVDGTITVEAQGEANEAKELASWNADSLVGAEEASSDSTSVVSTDDNGATATAAVSATALVAAVMASIL